MVARYLIPNRVSENRLLTLYKIIKKQKHSSTRDGQQTFQIRSVSITEKGLYISE